MTQVSVDKFLDLVQRSELIEGDRLQGMFDEVTHLEKLTKDRFSNQKSIPSTDINGLADYLVQKSWLSRWQCDQLLKGRFKGFILGKYKLLSQLSIGKESRLFLAEHIQMQSKSAIKVLHHQLTSEGTCLSRFYREAQDAGCLDHKNFVRLFDIDSNEYEIHYMVFEYVEGRDVQKIVMEDGRLNSRTAVIYALQIVEGLAHAHKMGLTHRNIEPANLLVDKENTVKMQDFGLNRIAEVNASFLGDPDYSSPEQDQNSGNVDLRTDIYSLGSSLYFMLTGEPQFPNSTMVQKRLKQIQKEPKSILENRPAVSEELASICQKMMAKNPDDRYQTAEEVHDALTDWLDGGLGAGVLRNPR